MTAADVRQQIEAAYNAWRGDGDKARAMYSPFAAGFRAAGFIRETDNTGDADEKGILLELAREADQEFGMLAEPARWLRLKAEALPSGRKLK